MANIQDAMPLQANASQKPTKMAALVNHRLRITLQDGRQLVGQMLAFDQYMNLVMSNCEEFRCSKKNTLKRKAQDNQADDKEDNWASKSDTNANETQLRRPLGLLVLRGEWIVSISIEGPPTADMKNRLSKGYFANYGSNMRPASTPSSSLPFNATPTSGSVSTSSPRTGGQYQQRPPQAFVPQGFMPQQR